MDPVRGSQNVKKVKPVRVSGLYYFSSRTICFMLSMMSLSVAEGQKASAAPIALSLEASSLVITEPPTMIGTLRSRSFNISIISGI